MATGFTLRPFQVQAMEIASANFLRGKNSVLALPPGTGKSVICISIIKRITKAIGGKVLIILPGKLVEHQYRHLLDDAHLDRVILVSSPNRQRLDQLLAKDIQAIIFEPLDNFPTKITEHVDVLFSCPKIVFTTFAYPPSEMIFAYKGHGADVDFRFSTQQIIEESVLERVKANATNDFTRLQQQVQQLTPKDQELFQGILKNIEEYQSSVEELSATLGYIIQSGLKKRDLEQLSFRKKQLAKFERLLKDREFFADAGGNEKAWQVFFERNTWIFGYGLTFIFNEPLKDRKLEQVVAGYRVNTSGKRTDALMKSSGVISTLCFTEIKTHNKQLLKVSSYREDSWPISDEVAGGIAQLQKTIHLSLQDLTSKLDLKNSEGFLDETIFMYKPKAYLIIGSLEEFTNEKGQINESKHSSFELFRRSLDIEIITFDELYYRARAIVESSAE
jgi:hypothetical protein